MTEVKTENALLALAERCEQATRPDRELDIEIVVATDWREPDWEEGERTAKDLADRHGIAWLAERAEYGMTVWRHLPRFTASLDAAMTLVPEGALVTMTGPAGKTYSVRVNDEVGLARSFALALCAAALRARAEADAPKL